jgi:hypothetical protein
MRHLLIIALALGIVSCGGRQRSATTADEKAETADMVIALSDSIIMNVGADTLSLGRVHEGEIISKTIAIRNSAEKPMVITKLDLTCGCITADYPKRPIKAGEEATMSLDFNSKGTGGWVYKTALIYTSLTVKPFMLVVTAEVER